MSYTQKTRPKHRKPTYAPAPSRRKNGTGPLSLSPYVKVCIHCETELQRRMREIWMRKRDIAAMNSHQRKPLADFYLDAFHAYLETHKVPKQIPIYDRSETRLTIPETEKKTLENLERIAAKREVSIAVVLEEALSEFCDRPENYLGKEFYKSFKQRKGKL